MSNNVLIELNNLRSDNVCWRLIHENKEISFDIVFVLSNASKYWFCYIFIQLAEMIHNAVCKLAFSFFLFGSKTELVGDLGLFQFLLMHTKDRYTRALITGLLLYMNKGFFPLLWSSYLMTHGVLRKKGVYDWLTCISQRCNFILKKRGKHIYRFLR